jgi:hypothetical protein
MTDSGSRQLAGGSATGVREEQEHRTENPGSALPDEPVAHALASARVHGCHQDCHHRGSAGAVRASGFWFLSTKSSLRTRSTRIFLGAGVGPRRKRGPIDLGNVEALRASQPHGRGDQRSRRPGSKQLIHHQVLRRSVQRCTLWLAVSSRRDGAVSGTTLHQCSRSAD